MADVRSAGGLLNLRHRRILLPPLAFLAALAVVSYESTRENAVLSFPIGGCLDPLCLCGEASES